MRKSRFDPLIAFVCIGIMLYFLFFEGFYYETVFNPAYSPPKEEILMIPGQVVYGGFFALVFSILFIAGDKLEQIPRGIFHRSIKNFKKTVHCKIEEGKQLNKKFFERRKNKRRNINA